MHAVKYRVCYVPGVWDLLHLGHLNLLRRARRICQVMAVGVVSDTGVIAYKHRQPVHDERTRMAVMQELKMVDTVLLQRTTNPTEQLEITGADALVHGTDWERLREGHESLVRLGVAFVRFPYTEGVSTTALIAAMAGDS